MLYLNLAPIFKARQIEKPYSFLVKIGIAPHTASKIIRNDMHVLRLNHIELICLHLHCEPNDLLAFKPDKNMVLSNNHPLNKLIPEQEDFNWQETLKTLPVSKLKEVAKFLYNTNKEDQ